MKLKEYLDFGQLVGAKKTLIMSESKYVKKILSYMAENKMKTALEAEVKYMDVEAIDKENHIQGSEIHFKPEPSDENNSLEG